MRKLLSALRWGSKKNLYPFLPNWPHQRINHRAMTNSVDGPMRVGAVEAVKAKANPMVAAAMIDEIRGKIWGAGNGGMLN